VSEGLPPGIEPVMRVPATPTQANTGGDIFGGWLMAQVDIAGSIPAVLRARGRVVTVAVKDMTFLKPVYVGDMVSLYAAVAATGRTSITVDVQVYVQRNPVALETHKISDARLTYVAVDEKGRPRSLPDVG